MYGDKFTVEQEIKSGTMVTNWLYLFDLVFILSELIKRRK